jgi:hypothetical protein
MPQGYVTTARGEVLNMDALKDAANLPLAKAKQTKTEVPKRDYRVRQPINVRGHQPVAGEHQIQDMPDGVAATVARLNPEEMPVKTSYTESGEATSLADVTGVKIKPSKEAIKRAKKRAGNEPVGVPIEDVAGAALTDILGDLEAANPNAQAAADAEEATPQKRTRSRKTASE